MRCDHFWIESFERFPSTPYSLRLGFEIHFSPMLDPAASVPLATVPYILQLGIFFFLFSSSFEILHSRLAEIDIRPYEIDGNQPDFGYD